MVNWKESSRKDRARKAASYRFLEEKHRKPSRMESGNPWEAGGFSIDGSVRSERTAIYAPNGGPIFKFNEAISFQIYCDTYCDPQEEMGHYWNRLSEAKDASAPEKGATDHGSDAEDEEA